MKILITTGIYPPEIGGPATYAFLVEKELKKRGHQVFVLPFRLVRKYPTIIRHFIYFLKTIKKIVWADIVLTQDTVSVGLPSVLASKILNKKIIIRVPGDFAWEQGTQRFGVKENIDDFQNKKYGFRVELLRKIQKFVVKNVDFVITPSEYFKNLVLGWGVENNKIIRIYNGVSIPEKIESKDFKKDTIVTAGRLVPWKGFDLLIKEIKNINANLVIVGDGEDKARLENLIKEYNVSDKVSLIGTLSREELLSYIKGSSLFVLPSFFESFSFQIVEAMMVGATVVALNTGNLNEIIDSDKNGVLIEKEKISDLSQILNSLLKDENTRKILSENAKKSSQKFNLENTVDELEKLLKKII